MKKKGSSGVKCKPWDFGGFPAVGFWLVFR
jgi:hypothetical protein